MLDRGRIVIGQVEEDESVQSALVVTVEGGFAPGAAAFGRHAAS